MTVYIIHVAYEPTLCGVFSSKSDAELELNRIAEHNEYPRTEMWVEEYEVQE